MSAPPADQGPYRARDRRPLPGLRLVDPGLESIADLVAALASALDGSGPALAPMPATPAAARSALLAVLRPELPLERDGIALVVATSGSTGEPKGVLLPATAVLAGAAATNDRLGGPGRWVVALPLTHVAGLMVLVRALLAGTSPVVMDRSGGFDPARFAAASLTAARASEGDGAPLYVSLVPTQLDRLLSAGVDLSSFDAVLLGAAAAPPDLLGRAERAGVRVVTTYGMSETCGGCVYDGRPLAGVDVDLEPVGEPAGGAIGERTGRIVLGGPVLFGGYRLRPDLTAAATDRQGRLRTADLGRLRAGRLQVLGRIDDVIVSGGVKVLPARVEAVVGPILAGAAGTLARGCAVVGVPDPVWGERVVVVVVARPGPGLPALQELRSAAAAQLPREWLPREIVRVDDLPMLPTGKVDRRALRSLVDPNWDSG